MFKTNLYMLIHDGEAMEKTIPVYLRLPSSVKKSLERTAAKDKRTMANLSAKILTEWVAANG